MWSIILCAAAVCAFPCGIHKAGTPVAPQRAPCAAVAAQPEADGGEPERVARITVDAKGKQFTYTDDRIIPSDFTVAEYIETHKINAPLSEKLEFVDSLLKKGASYKTALGVCFPRLSATVDKVAAQLYALSYTQLTLPTKRIV